VAKDLEGQLKPTMKKLGKSEKIKNLWEVWKELVKGSKGESN